jgi:hypothetical protein
MLPVAVPYYGYKFVARDGSSPPEEPVAASDVRDADDEPALEDSPTPPLEESTEEREVDSAES